MNKSNSTAKTASPDGLKTINVQGARPGVNPNKGYPAKANITGKLGGSPGIKPSNGGARNTGTMISQSGSGHVTTEARRSSNTGFGLLHKSVAKSLKSGGC